MELLAALLGQIAGKLSDPAVWIMMGAAALAGFKQGRIWLPLLAAAVYSLFLFGALWQWWEQLGLDPYARMLPLFIVNAILAYAAYYAAKFMASRVKPDA